jgi:hypothetical protein
MEIYGVMPDVGFYKQSDTPQDYLGLKKRGNQQIGKIPTQAPYSVLHTNGMRRANLLMLRVGTLR